MFFSSVEKKHETRKVRRSVPWSSSCLPDVYTSEIRVQGLGFRGYRVFTLPKFAKPCHTVITARLQCWPSVSATRCIGTGRRCQIPPCWSTPLELAACLLSSWVDTLYTFWDNTTYSETKSVHFGGLMNSATKPCTGFELRNRTLRVLGRAFQRLNHSPQKPKTLNP